MNDEMNMFAYIMSTIALFLYCGSYFFNSKKKYLVLQLSGNVFLAMSYFFMGAYFTMFSVAVGVARGLICYTYEKNNKKVPVYMIVGVCFITVASCVLINYVILSGRSSQWDFLYMFASCMYAITFAIRNIKLMRYLVLIPHLSAVLYNLLANAPLTSGISYAIEFAITVVAIVKFHIQEKCTKNDNALHLK